MSNFHIVVIFNDYYTEIVAFFDQIDAEQKQTCCKPNLHNMVLKVARSGGSCCDIGQN